MASTGLILDPLADLAARLSPPPAALPLVLNEDTPPDLPPEQLPDVSHMLDTLDEHLTRLLAQWDHLSAAQKQQLVDEIRLVAEHGQVTDLPDITVDAGATSAALTAAMVAIAIIASRQVVDEAAAQGVEVAVVHLPASVFGPVAEVVARLLADELRITAVRAALQTGPDATPEAVAEAARVALDALSDAGPTRQLGGSLHGAMNTARYATLRRAPEGALYASEQNDKRTCEPCREVNGRWLGNISDLDQADRHPRDRTGVLALYPDGAYGGYIFCLGGVNCRGTVTGVWRPAQVGDEGEDA